MRRLLGWTRAALVLSALGGLAACSTTSTTSPSKPESSATPVEVTKRESGPADSRRRANIRLQLAVGYYQDGKFAAAIDELKQAVALDPNYADVYTVQALVYNELHQDALAEQNFQRALQLEPNNSDLNNNFGWYLCQHGREKDSLAYFETALKDPLYPQKAKPLQNAGVCAGRLGNAALSEDYFRRSFELDPTGSVSAYNLASIYYDRKDFSRARFYVSQVNNSQVPTPASLWLGIRIERRLGNRRTRSRSRASSTACSPTRARRRCRSAATTATDRADVRTAASATRPLQDSSMEPGDDTVAATDMKPGHEGVGAMLRARRVELGLSQSDVASMVKLPASRIEAMEQERWGDLPDGPFLRGFLRNVARALHLDATWLTDQVDASLMRASSPESIFAVPQAVVHATLPRRSGPADGRHGGRALVYGAFLFALLAALIAWSGTDSFDRTIVSAKALVGPSKPVVVAAAPSPVAAGATAEATPPATPAQVDATAPAPADKLVGAPPAVSSDLALSFHFNEESWVEVRSADGKVLLQQLNAAGSEQQIAGEAPFSLVVGNAKGVALRFRGQPVDLAPYTRDAVARFKLS